MLDHFKTTYAITEEEVLKMLAKQTIEQIGADQIAIMLSTQQALKDGDTTVEELLKDIRTKVEKVDDKKKELKEKLGKGVQARLL